MIFLKGLKIKGYEKYWLINNFVFAFIINNEARLIPLQ
jgi:hypothetical protein